MAFRNSVKATLLLEPEQPRLRSDEPGPVFKSPAPPPKPVAQREWKRVVPRTPEDAFLAAAWHARAEELCAMADTLPSKTSWSLVSKIAVLYDEIARDAGWTPEEALPAPDPGPTEEPEVFAAPKSEIVVPPAELLPALPLVFPRRPLPQGRPVARRRA